MTLPVSSSNTHPSPTASENLHGRPHNPWLTVVGTVASLLAFAGLIGVMHATDGGQYVIGEVPSPTAGVPGLPGLPGTGPAQPPPTTGGDPKKGQALFVGKVLNCAGCHTVDGKGGQVGPNLSGVALRFDRNAFRTKISNPSEKIRPDYRQLQVLTADGEQFVGLVKEKTADKIVLIVNEQGKTVEVKTDDIEQLAESKLSIMPAGLTSRIPPADFEDLLAYLETLKDPSDPGKPKTN